MSKPRTAFLIACAAALAFAGGWAASSARSASQMGGIPPSRSLPAMESAQLEGVAGELKKGDVVTCEVTDVKEGGLDVKIAGTDLETFIRRADLARDRGDQRSDRFQVGQKFDARVTQFDRKSRKVSVSIKALEMAEEKEAIAQYGSSDSGATLGDILGTALKRAGDKAEDKADD